MQDRLLRKERTFFLPVPAVESPGNTILDICRRLVVVELSMKRSGHAADVITKEGVYLQSPVVRVKTPTETPASLNWTEHPHDFEWNGIVVCLAGCEVC